MSWIVRNLLLNQSLVRSNVFDSEGIMVTYDTDSPDYNNLLAVEKKITELEKEDIFSPLEKLILLELEEGRTLNDICRLHFIHKNTIRAAFDSLCSKISFSLGGIFTDEGYVEYMINTYDLNDFQAKKLIEIIRGNNG